MDTDYQDNEPCRFRIALKVIRVIRVICEICGLKARKNQISVEICVPFSLTLLSLRALCEINKLNQNQIMSILSVYVCVGLLLLRMPAVMHLECDGPVVGSVLFTDLLP
jgi:hypothetical protein